jgi:zinc-ribbon domain
MAFCENCGTQLSDAAKFCRSCGKDTGTEAASPVSTPSKSRGPNTKLILGGVAFLVLLGAGAFLYFSHRASQKAEEVTQQISPDINAVLNSIPTPGSQPPAASPAAPAPAAPMGAAGFDPNKIVTPEQGQCALFSKEELTRVLGTDFTHSIPDATGCTYKGDVPRQYVRTEAYWKGGRELVKLKTDTYAALHQSMVNQKYTKAEIAAHLFPISPYAGAGDEAWVDLINIVTARKGDVGIVMDLRYYRDSDDLTRLFVNTALSRLSN